MLREMTREILDKAPYVWLPTPYVYTAWWPWVKNYDGELRVGATRARPDLCAHLDRPGAEEEDGVLTARRPSAPAGPSRRRKVCIGQCRQPLLQVRNLTTRFNTERGRLTAVDQVSFDIGRGRDGRHRRRVGLRQERDRAVDHASDSRRRPAASRAARSIFEGQDLLTLDDAGIRAIRGNKIAMIFQEPMTSLNPVLTVGQQIGGARQPASRLPWGKAGAGQASCLGRVRIPDAASRLAPIRTSIRAACASAS